MGRRPRVLISAAAFSCLLPGCDKPDAAAPASTDPAATATVSASASNAEASERADVDVVPSGSTASSSATTHARGGDGGTADAGPTPAEAPLLFWMRDHMAPAMRQGDSMALAAAYEELATLAPKESGYPNWASIAKDGADAARAGSPEGVKAACRGCHAQYRATYKASLRARPLPL